MIRLNVGGIKYETTTATLAGSPYFKALMSGNFGPNLGDGDGEYFVDRDGEPFRYILTYLRTNHCHITDREMAVRVLREADFYGIEGLVKALTDSLGERRMEEYTDGGADFLDPQYRVCMQYTAAYGIILLLERAYYP